MSKESITFNKFQVYSNENDSDSVDVRSGISILEYRESVFSPSVSVNCFIVDTGNSFPTNEGTISLLESIKCQGYEQVDFSIQDGNGNKIEFNDLRVTVTSNITSSIKRETFTLSLTSEDSFNNCDENTWCKQTSFPGKISDIVKSILVNNLKTKKKLNNFDETLNTFPGKGGGKNPFEVIGELQKIAIPSSINDSKTSLSSPKGKVAGYLFWETSEGYCFKSLDKLFEVNGNYLKYTDGRGKRIKHFVQDNKNENEIPKGFDGRILYFKTDRTINALQQIENGGYGTRLYSLDRIEGEFDSTNSIVSSGKGNGVIAGRNLPNFGEFNNKVTNHIIKTKSKGQTFILGDSIEQQVEKTTLERYEINDVEQQSKQNYRQKFNMSAEIVIPADFSLHAGDLIYCEFQELSSVTTVSSSLRRNSGIYMIAGLCHYANKSKSYTRLHLVRDSYGRK